MRLFAVTAFMMVSLGVVGNAAFVCPKGEMTVASGDGHTTYACLVEYEAGHYFQDGPMAVYSSNGELVVRANLKKNELDGRYEQWKDGSMLFFGAYKNGIKEGEWFYLENGEVVRREVYINGELVRD